MVLNQAPSFSFWILPEGAGFRGVGVVPLLIGFKGLGVLGLEGSFARVTVPHLLLRAIAVCDGFD